MEMQFKNEIKKLADIVVWADTLITAGGYYEEKYRDDTSTAYCSVKAHELWKIKTVVLEAIDRHTAYTNALNKDIADKAAKIDLLEKEIEGRKEGYYASKEKYDTLETEIEGRKKAFNDLREEMANRYIAIETHNDICKTYENKVAELEKELEYCKVKIRHHRENLNGINKTLEIRTKENERLIAVKNNQEKEIEAHEAENARLSEKIISMNDTIIELSHDIDNYKSWNKKLSNDHIDEIAKKNKEIEKLKVDLIHEREKNEKLARAHAELENDMRKSYTDIISQSKTICNLKKELDETYRTKEADLKNHNKRDMTLVDELAKKNDEIKGLKEEISRLNARIKCDTEYWKKAFEAQSVDLAEEKKHNKELNEVITELKEKRDKLKKELNRVYGVVFAPAHEKEDDHGRTGFKKYIEYLIEEEERAVPERFKARLNEEIETIFTKEEETEVKDVKEPVIFDEYHKYNWFPCGDDSIE